MIALSCLEPIGIKTTKGGFHAHHVDLELREPVGSRVVVDASVGVVRPSRAELRSRARDAPGFPAFLLQTGMPESPDVRP